MDRLFKRPLMLVCLCFFVGSCLFARLSSELRLLFCLLFPVLFLFLLLFTWRSRSLLRRSALLGFLALFLSAVFSYVNLDIRTASAYELDGQTLSFTGTVTETVSVTSYSGYYAVSGEEIGSGGSSFTFMLTCNDPTLVPGDRITGTALFSLFPESENGFPLRSYYLGQDVLLEAECSDTVIYLERDDSLSFLIKDLNRRLCGIVSSLLPRDEAALVNALLLGNRDSLPDEATRNFRRLGISHMLAISGMHLSVLTFFLDRLLSLFLRKRCIRRVLLLISIVFFMVLTGLSPSVVRAGLMLILYECMFLLSAREDAPSALFYAAVIILLFQPYAALDVGLQLSVSAMAACLLFGSIGRKRKSKEEKAASLPLRLLRKGGSLFFLSLYILYFILPLSHLYFGEVSLLSPVMNVLFSPLISLLLLFSPLLLLLSGSYFLSGLLAIPLRLLASAVLELASFFAGANIPAISLRYAAAPAVIGILFILVLAFPFAGRKRRIAYVAAALAASCLLAGHVAFVRKAEAEKVIVHLNHRLKSDTLLLFSENKVLLCDFSDGSYAAIRGALGVLDESYLIDLDVLLLTHYHKRHIDTVQSLCSKRFVGEIWLPVPETEAESGTAASIIETAEMLGTAVRIYDPETETLLFGDAVITVSPRGYIKRSTHPVLYLSVEAFEKDYMYLGASVMESDLASAAKALFSDSEVAVIGVHGPIYKKMLSLSAPTLSRLLFTGGTEEFFDRTASDLPALSFETTVNELHTVILTQTELIVP